MNGCGTQGDETEGGAVVSFSQSLSSMRSHDIHKKRTKRQKDREKTGEKCGDKWEEKLWV